MFVCLAARGLATIHSFFSRSLYLLRMLVPIRRSHATLSRNVILDLVRTMTTGVSGNAGNFSLVMNVRALNHIFRCLRVVSSNGLRSHIRLTNCSYVVSQGSHTNLVYSHLFSRLLIGVRNVQPSVRGCSSYATGRGNVYH